MPIRILDHEGLGRLLTRQLSALPGVYCFDVITVRVWRVENYDATEFTLVVAPRLPELRHQLHIHTYRISGLESEAWRGSEDTVDWFFNRLRTALRSIHASELFDADTMRAFLGQEPY